MQFLDLDFLILVLCLFYLQMRWHLFVIRVWFLFKFLDGVPKNFSYILRYGMPFVCGQLVKPKVPVCPVNPQTEFCNCPGLVRPNFGTDYFPPGQLVSKLDRKSGAMFTFFITKFYYLNLKGPKVFINMGTLGSLVTLKYTCALFIHLRFPMKLRRI